VRAGTFDEAAAVGLAVVEAEGRAAGRWVVPIDRLLAQVPAVVLNDRDMRRATHGNDIAFDDTTTPAASGAGAANAAFPAGGDARWRLLDEGGRLVAIAEPRAGGVLHPVIVLM
jgi:tRNA U55 pseudouridine synthase TruB